MDNKNDLNVYNDVTQPDDAKSTCCGSNNKVEVAAGDPLVGLRSQLKEIDFNEWAGP